MHAEMPIHKPGGQDPFGLQLWIDLPKQHKLVDPSYQELKASEIPSAHPTPNVLIKVICGEADGSASEGVVSSPVRPLGGCWFADVIIGKKGDKVFHRVPKGWNAFIYTLEGEVLIGPSTPNTSNRIPAFHTAVLSNQDGENGVELESATDRARLVVVAGEPLDQEIVQHGPFVMDTPTGIRQAFMDYQFGRNGFEGAHEWQSEIGSKPPMYEIVPGSCKIPSFCITQTDTIYAFLDIGPLSKGHALVIPKYHAAKLHDLPDAHMSEILVTLKKIAVAQGLEDYNVLQNNGRVAHQVVDHVHFHLIPKPSASDSEGLVIGWPTHAADMDELKKFAEALKGKL
ncbi:hypothetical protein JCM1841_005064 [Sporobolomyces salmonicolor]